MWRTPLLVRLLLFYDGTSFAGLTPGAMAAPTVGYMVQVVKGTPVASLIGIAELTRTAVMVNTVRFEPLRVFGIVCVAYLVIPGRCHN